MFFHQFNQPFKHPVLIKAFSLVVFSVFQFVKVKIIASEIQTSIDAARQMFNAVDCVKKRLCLFLIVTFAFFKAILALLFVINIRIIHFVQSPYSSKSLLLPCKESPGKVCGTSQLCSNSTIRLPVARLLQKINCTP